MANEKNILKEGVTTEEKQQILELSLGAEEAVLKLYKYVATNIQDEQIINPISSLKTKIAEFNMSLKSRAEASEVRTEPEQDNSDKGFIENSNDDVPSRSLAHESVNKRTKLSESVWDSVIDISKEWNGLLKEAKQSKFTTSGKSFKQLILSLKKYKNSILDESKKVAFENAIDDITYLTESNNIESFDKSFNNLYNWADKNKVLVKI